MSSIRVERTYPHPRGTVWRALTDSELLARWLMPNDFEPRLGHRFTFQTEPAPGFDGVVHCEVKEITDQQSLVLSWRGGPVDTIVRFTLEDVEGGTRMVMEQSGFQGVKAWLVSRMLKAGCRTIYGTRLPQVLAEIDRSPTDAPEPSSTPPSEEACMTPGQGVIKALLRIINK